MPRVSRQPPTRSDSEADAGTTKIDRQADRGNGRAYHKQRALRLNLG